MVFDADRFVSGDRDYAAGVIREHHGFVLLVCRAHAQDADEAEDLAQETWKAVVKHATSFRGSGPFRAWLYRIALNACHSAHRTRRADEAARAHFIARSTADIRPTWMDPQRIAERRELHFSIHRALGELTDGERSALVLRVLEGRSTNEVADQLGVAPATVRSHVRHGIDHLRRIMEDPDSDLFRYRETS